MAKEVAKIEIDEKTGEVKVDILNAVGPSCAKDADEWAKLFGGPKNITKKPEFYKSVTKKQENTQTQG